MEFTFGKEDGSADHGEDYSENPPGSGIDLEGSGEEGRRHLIRSFVEDRTRRERDQP